MSSVNKVILLGRLGRDPEVRYSPDGAAICNASIATSSSWKDKNTGEKKEETEWHRVVMYNRIAEIAGEYLKKGHLAYFEGRLKTRKWQDKDTGADKFTTEIVVDKLQLLPNATDSGQGDGGQQQSRPAQGGQQRAQGTQGAQRGQDYQNARSGSQRPANQSNNAAPNWADMDQDIPF